MQTLSSSRNCSDPCEHLSLQVSKPHTPWDSPIDQGPYVNVTENGMVAASNDEQTTENEEDSEVLPTNNHHQSHESIPEEEKIDQVIETDDSRRNSTAQTANLQGDAKPLDVISPFKRYLGQLSRQSRWSLWLLLYIAVTTSWPLVGSALRLVLGKKSWGVLPGKLHRR